MKINRLFDPRAFEIIKTRWPYEVEDIKIGVEAEAWCEKNLGMRGIFMSDAVSSEEADFSFSDIHRNYSVRNNTNWCYWRVAFHFKNEIDAVMFKLMFG